MLFELKLQFSCSLFLILCGLVEFLATDLKTRIDSWHYQIVRVVVGLERGPLSLVSTMKELLERKNSGSGLENQDYSHRDPLHRPCNTPLSE
jgi:hypothetical protein